MNKLYSRKKKLMLNTFSSLIFQGSTIVCGFILPRLILKYYGSEVNGLVNSITQFLQVITFLELGVGAVVQSSLYRPLAEKDDNKISEIITSAEKFFKILAVILLVYVIILFIIYPHIAKQDFGWLYTSLLILAMSISTFAQYYFGVVDRLLLTADQRGYVQYNAQTITLIMNTLLCVILIKMGASIHIVKLTTSIVYLVRPICLRIYVNKNYNINRRMKYSSEPIKQKWNGVAQHIAAVVLDGTDTIVLTVFSTLSNVSIYSVYHLVIYGVKQLFISMTNGMHALLGELWAKKEVDTLYETFGWFEWLIHTGTVIIFGCTGMLVVPFIQVYTSGINDANYIQPLFAALLTIAHAGHCLRLPYNLMILAAGHYKQTQNKYIIAAIINVVISVITVRYLGLIGVAIGTMCATFYHTIWMSLYTSKRLINWSFKNVLKQIFVDIIISILGIYLTYNMSLRNADYLSWVIMGIKTGTIWLLISILFNSIFYKEKVCKLYKKIIMKKR